MIRGGDEIARLQRIVDELQREWYGAGRGADFERYVARYQARGEWPFADVTGRADAPAAPQERAVSCAGVGDDAVTTTAPR